jgi:hypothetical protein
MSKVRLAVKMRPTAEAAMTGKSADLASSLRVIPWHSLYN